MNRLYFKVPISCLGILHIYDLWILLKKIAIYLVGRKCYLRGLFCCWSWRKWRQPRNLSHNCREFWIFKRVMDPIRFKTKWYIFSMSITACFHYKTDSWVDVYKTAKTDTLQFLSGVFKDFKYVKYPMAR